MSAFLDGWHSRLNALITTVGDVTTPVDADEVVMLTRLQPTFLFLLYLRVRLAAVFTVKLGKVFSSTRSLTSLELGLSPFSFIDAQPLGDECWITGSDCSSAYRLAF